MLKRSITGLILGIIMIIGFLYSFITASLLLTLITIGAGYEWTKHFIPKNTTYPYWIFTFLGLVLILLMFLMNFNILQFETESIINIILPLSLILIIIYAISAVFLHSNWDFSLSWYSGIAYLFCPVLLSALFLYEDFSDHRWFFFGLIIINWSNDVFAYFTGRTLGKHLLAPQISPKKTIEGAIGGLLAAIAAAFILNKIMFVSELDSSKTLLLGFSVWAAGTCGDLYESRLKRMAGIKDSGNLLPGHGGFLDRFDSFFFVVVIGIFVFKM